MTVNLHIEKLVLDGLPVDSHEGPLVQAALQAELTRLLAGEAFAGAPQRAVPLVRAQPIAAPARTADGLGAQIGQAIFGGLRS